ncbi:MAG: DUF4760 domain-containing protein [Phycisphaerae bacterium]|nr:DUF4760 domain-containing protein [Phycisphaerae bacterium]
MIDVGLRVFLAVGAIGTLAGAWLVYFTLKANHDWARRKYAIDMLSHWNEHVYPHFRAIENVYPHVRQFDHGEKKFKELTYDTAKEVWKCDPDDAAHWKVKSATLELLNYFEFITTAYSQNVADPAIIEHSFRNALVQWHDILTNFIKVAQEGLGFQPWQPFLDVVATWKSPGTQKRKKTA